MPRRMHRLAVEQWVNFRYLEEREGLETGWLAGTALVRETAKRVTARVSRREDAQVAAPPALARCVDGRRQTSRRMDRLPG